jgi:bifunctional NMN adenylyltransferase/nudix hydrolase
MAKNKGLGIIIGRFQVLEINEMHKALIDEVSSNHERVLIFLGSSPAPSSYNPIDFPFRWQMVSDAFENEIEVLEMPDLPDDRIWSQELDRRILEQKPEGVVTLYGTENNFIKRYSGSCQTKILEAQLEASDEIIEIESIENLRDFRAGLLYASMRQYPTVYPTVDIAVFRNGYKEVLLAKKANETKYRFPGGFTDPDDGSYEEAILRELGEECGNIEIRDLIYLGSARLPDWRYVGSSDVVITHLYACELVDGEPQPDDDISEVQWVEITKLKLEHFVLEHRPLLGLLEGFLYDDK